MKKIGLILICSLLLISRITGQQIEPTYVLLKNAFIIDCIGEQAKRGDLLIKSEKIESIDYKDPINPPKGCIIYDLSDQYILPGLIDAHVHFATDPSGQDNLEDTKRRLRNKLEHGITSVRDMAGDARSISIPF